MFNLQDKKQAECQARFHRFSGDTKAFAAHCQLQQGHQQEGCAHEEEEEEGERKITK